MAIGFASGAGAAVSFTPLGVLPGQTVSTATGVSGDGSVVVGGSGDGISLSQAFRWTAGGGGLQPLGYFAGGSPVSGAADVSADGQTIVGSARDSLGVLHAFRRGNNNVMTDLGVLPGGIPSESQSNGVSADGSVVVGNSWYTVFNHREAFRWTQAGGMVSLGDLAGGDVDSQASAVSADGTIVVGSGTPSNGLDLAFRWTAAGGMKSIGTLPGQLASAAVGISDDGSTIVGYAYGAGYAAFRWTAGGGMQPLGTLNGVPCLAYDASADGSVIVGRAYDESDVFFWTQATGMRSVTQLLQQNNALPPGYQLHFVTAISGDGNTIVGFGSSPTRSTEAFVVTLPEPGALGVIALLACVLPRRRGAWVVRHDTV